MGKIRCLRSKIVKYGSIANQEWKDDLDPDGCVVLVGVVDGCHLIRKQNYEYEMDQSGFIGRNDGCSDGVFLRMCKQYGGCVF